MSQGAFKSSHNVVQTDDEVGFGRFCLVLLAKLVTKYSPHAESFELGLGFP
jgi:hypothetical protein